MSWGGGGAILLSIYCNIWRQKAQEKFVIFQEEMRNKYMTKFDH